MPVRGGLCVTLNYAHTFSLNACLLSVMLFFLCFVSRDDGNINVLDLGFKVVSPSNFPSSSQHQNTACAGVVHADAVGGVLFLIILCRHCCA